MRAIPRNLCILGTFLDARVALPGGTQTGTLKKRGYVVAADSTGRRLWLVPRPKGKRASIEAAQASVADVFRRWSQFAADGVFRQTVRLAKPQVVGRVVTIGYRSGKWTNQPDDYEHEFDTPPRVTRFGDVYRIAGATLEVTPAGIVG